ncbi:ficolin-2-like isoform X1 [Glossina fuscipes]|uniref:Ficolin-2-like isoform X1 n=1 Tax=Glossina fuscipes TaxID=7396 RepID=A0A9C5ZPE5_9MUSC|nr:ficolin-2-like isoform X1 [Glossina fuscipes]KAI9575496.1 hypothetical protein GQX74_013511 [Glossina fuscipes]
MHFSIYAVVILSVGRLRGAKPEEQDMDAEIRDAIEELTESNNHIQMQLNLIQSELEKQSRAIEQMEEHAEDTNDKLETILEQSQEANQKSLEFINELRNNLREITAKINEIAGRHQPNSPVDRVGEPNPSGYSYPKSCADHNSNYCEDETCRIKISRFSTEFLVPCEYDMNGDGWTIVQKRYNGSVDFHRNWVDYKSGFGNVHGEFWIGLDKLHVLTTTQGRQELLVVLENYHGDVKYARYDAFEVGPKSQRYKLKLGTYKGDAGDSLRYHENAGFHTKDNDETKECVKKYKGGWWYKNCLRTNPNGIYYRTEKALFPGTGIYWRSFVDADESLKAIRMMIRPKDP